MPPNQWRIHLFHRASRGRATAAQAWNPAARGTTMFTCCRDHTTLSDFTALRRHRQILSGRSRASRLYGTRHLCVRVRPCRSPNEQAPKVQIDGVSTSGSWPQWDCWHGCLRSYRVPSKEAERHQLEFTLHDILDWEVFWPSRMVKPEGVLDYEIPHALLRVLGASYERGQVQKRTRKPSDSHVLVSRNLSGEISEDCD